MKRTILGIMVCLSLGLFIAVAPAQATVDVIYEGSVSLTPNETFNVTAYNSGTTYTVNQTTPLGALDTAAKTAVFTYDVTDKKMASMGILLLDNIGSYMYDEPGEWFTYVNDVYKDGFADQNDAINNFQVVHGDTVEFYYAADVMDESDLTEVQGKATAAVKTVVSTGATPEDWDLDLVGATSKRVTKADFEEGVACGHYANWTDTDTGEFWEGMPLWYLVGMVDDDETGSHWTFNDALADDGYSITVTASDGWSTSLDSADIKRDDGYIVANKLNGSELPLNTSSGKPCWPLHLKGPSVSGGQQVGSIVRIELVGLPQPPEGWILTVLGEVGDTISQAEFEDAVACHGVQYVDGEGTWEGVPLWYLCGAVDDLETTSHWTFNDSRAASSYTVNVMAADGYNRNFASSTIARNNSYIVANTLNGEPLDYTFPLKLVGSAVFGGNKVSNINQITLVELVTPSPEPGGYNLNLTGKITDVLSQAEFEAAIDCHGMTWTDNEENEWRGIPLWYLCGWVDDRIPHGPDAFNANAATAGYTIIVKAQDGYAKDFNSPEIAWSNEYIIANTVNSEPLNDSFPLRLVGDGVTRADGSLGGSSVGNIAEIELTDFNATSALTMVHIVKYVSPTNLSVLNETSVTYLWMEQHLPVYGDGETVYNFEGVVFSGDIWDRNETYPGIPPFKISNAIKGTSVRDLCELVGGMGEGTEIKLVAPDGYETALGYANIYIEALTPEQRTRQGEAVLAWFADGQYVPGYADGIRLFFTPDDHIFGQWDMHECMNEKYWHYYWSEGIQYPSCAGLATKWVTTIEIFAEPEAEWNLTLEGAITDTISKSYFEQGIACAMGGHAAQYTDSRGRTWGGLPLWYLCGWVDDDNPHSESAEGAYNDTRAAAGYNITIFARDGYNVTIDSRDTIRNNGYIVANSLNGSHFPADDEIWPLRLVGSEVSGGLQVRGIVKIMLEFPEEPAPTPKPTPSPVVLRGGGGGGTPRDSDGDGYADIEEILAGTNSNDPDDYPGKPAVTPAPVPATPTPAPATPVPTPMPTPTAAPATPVPPTPTPEEPGFEALFAIASLLAIAFLVLNRRR